MARRRIVNEPDAEVLAMLRADIREIFGNVETMLWPHEIEAVRRWLVTERALWGYGRDAPPDGTNEAFADVRAWLLGQMSKARAYQRRQMHFTI